MRGWHENVKVWIGVAVSLLLAIIVLIVVATSSEPSVATGSQPEPLLAVTPELVDQVSATTISPVSQAETAVVTAQPTQDDDETTPSSITPPVATQTTDCTIYVSTNGADDNSGASKNAALRNPDTAANRAEAGDVVCISAGRYGSLKVERRNGNDQQPITFKSIDGEAEFAFGDYDSNGGRGAVWVNDSSHINLIGLTATKSMKGIIIDGSNNVEVLDCRVFDTGQEAIHVGNKSSYVRVAGCDVSDTGKRQGTGPGGTRFQVWAELVYIGSGSKPGDATHNVIIEDNVLHDNGSATSEAINVKSSTRDVTIRNNHIYNIDSWCEGAISVEQSPNLVVQGNVIHDITASGVGGNGAACRNAIGIRVRSTNVLVENNLVFNAAQYGILADNGSSGTVRNNTMFNNGTDFENRTGVATSGNLTSDGTNGRQISAGDFAGPLNDLADAGQGPGSGFKLLSGDGGFSLF